MVSPNETSVTIIGGGIVGLTVALQLHAAGFRDVHIFEKARKMAPLGVGIGLHPCAVLVLRNLGLLPAMKATGVISKNIVFNDQWGNRIFEMPRGTGGDSTVPDFMIHRGRLQMMLAVAVKERLGEDHVHADHAVTSTEEVGSKIIARFACHDSEHAAIPSREADVLLGADGIHSTIRANLYPDEGPPLFSGLTMWRGATMAKPMYDGSTIAISGWSSKLFIGYPISKRTENDEQLFNWVCVLRTRAADDPDKTPPTNVSWDATAPRGDLIAEFDGWKQGGIEARDLIEKSDQIWLYPMSDRDPLDRWSFGRLTLIGDAAHPMYPFGGHGATQGIMDCESFVNYLLGADDVPAALKAYEADRLPKTAKIVLTNRGDGGIQGIPDLVHERAPDGFNEIKDIISPKEIEERTHKYAQTTGNEVSDVNEAAAKTEGTAERLGLVSPKAWV